MDEQSNFFLLLEIDPNAPWDEARFQQVLRQKQSQWSSESMGIGARAIAAQKKKALIPEIKQVMSDPTQRAAHARTARAQAGTLKQRRFEEFEQHLRENEKKGFLAQEDIDRLARDFQDIVTEAQICAQARVPIREAEPEVEAPPQLEPTVLDSINELLVLINQPDLYHLLVLPSTAASPELVKAVESLYDELLKRQPKTPKVNALLRLLGHARSIFRSEELRQQYDEMLRLKALAARPGPKAGNVPQATAVEEIKDLKCQNLQTALRLTWTWPDGCNEVRLSYCVGGWPEQGRQPDATLKVMRAEYEARGHYDLPGAWYQHYFIIVAAIFSHNSSVITTPGVRIQSYLTGKVHITYEIKNPRFMQKQRALYIYTKTPGVLPTLLVIGKKSAIPLQKSDGTLLHRIEGPISIANELVIPLAEMPFQPNTFVRLFLEDDMLSNAVRIDLPLDRKVRLD